jgi:hypothetical protein
MTTQGRFRTVSPPVTGRYNEVVNPLVGKAISVYVYELLNQLAGMQVSE